MHNTLRLLRCILMLYKSKTKNLKLKEKKVILVFDYLLLLILLLTCFIVPYYSFITNK